MTKNRLKVLFVAYECAPFFKFGGLGDVAGSLPKALKELGVDIRVVMPYYRRVEKLGVVKLVKENIRLQIGDCRLEIGLYKSYLPGSSVPIYFIDNKKWFHVKHIFDKDEKERFVLFSAIAGKLPEIIKWQPDIIHGNDWQTGLIPTITQKSKLKSQSCNSKPKTFNNERIRTIYTIHNLAYTGKTPLDILEQYGFRREYFSGVDEKDSVNIMREAILAADMINTVSPTYAKEILTKEYGAGMEDILKKRKKDLYGIVNGLDYGMFNPETDKAIKVRYEIKNIERKLDNKLYLQKINKLSIKPETPLIGMVTRLASQKGLDLMETIFDELMKEELQLVVLGSGSEYYESYFGKMNQKYRDKFRANLKFDVGLASQIYAGADLFLMPSKYEPCGLGQLIAMKYGAVPIVRSTGGLKDTVDGAEIEELNIDFNNQDTRYNNQKITNNRFLIAVDGKFSITNINKATGFSFEKYDAIDLLNTIRQALMVYQDQTAWRRLQINGMKQDWSWGKSAWEYLKLYQKSVN
ncbi:hypothetical protein COV56_00980 [Candidatus Kuenenbacteria bacterium CG11_big_fil_rev_8_21_14_0_20_37_9]|uniref:Glycogen synthase n=2 Tax=Candidatus Kueneniibacteriota TaxID=1752740 RepID=A0A2M6XS41_9BACT|nr:MAG: hypothetical protein AUJ29_00270 [Candidatus Kuenenbacteria bacterium CG1_02_38_13]PIR05777.1 MAG: hypothetical protein COV56_00980 [Candidatus Kuenenbacteria bacterium CG11_big_fil_rev_8_21_14_0_20_37_9]PIU10458.1 MAG: hypothetical protein COT27_03005 [Candidatus Kuenenbacteria bacterium CG08_land_8_20_14_0_20_37_23]